MVTSALSLQQRSELISRNSAEFLGGDELGALIESGAEVRHYIGFEISGKVHLGTGLVSMAKIRDLQQAGVKCHVFLADWHTWINDKLGGDRAVIRRVAIDYFARGLRAGLACVGGDPDAVTFVLGSDLYNDRPDYWATLVQVAKQTSLARMQRSITIMGRQEGDNVDFAKLLYPAMQAADIFVQNIHIAHAGMDQRKAHVIARDVATHITVNPVTDGKGKTVKPMALHHPLILGLSKPPVWPIPEGQERDVMSAMKMSKSKPGSAVFIHDTPEEIRKKVSKAFCTPGDVSFNPVLDWIEKLVFGVGGENFTVQRSAENGGPVTYTAYSDVAAAFSSGALHPMDAKAGLSEWLIEILAPARAVFEDPAQVAMLAELDSLTGSVAAR